MPTVANVVAAAAKDRVRHRLQQRSRSPLTHLLSAVGDEVDQPSLLKAAQEFAAVVGVDVECFRPNDRLGELLRVKRDELPTSVHAVLPRLGLSDVVDPYAFDLLHFVEQRVGRDRKKLSRPAFLPMPASEEEWIERISTLSVAELLASVV